MDFSEAISVTKKMVNHFKAFEKIDEVIKLALNADQAEKDARARKDKLEEEIRRDEKDFEVTKKLRESEITKLQRGIFDLIGDVAQHAVLKKQMIAMFKADVKSQEEQAAQAIKESKERADKSLKELKDREETMKSEIKELQKLLDGMLSKVDSVRNQIKGGE